MITQFSWSDKSLGFDARPTTNLDINAKAQLSILKPAVNTIPIFELSLPAPARFTENQGTYRLMRNIPDTVDVNGINKIAGEQYHLLYQEVYGITSSSSASPTPTVRGCVLRMQDKLFGHLDKKLARGKPVQVFGNGKQRRDYNYVEDVLDALLIAATENNAVGKVYNLGAPDPLSLEDTAKIMCQGIQGSDYLMIPFPEERKAIDVGDFICNYSAFQNQFGWVPKVNFQEGIQLSIEYFRKEIKHYL